MSCGECVGMTGGRMRFIVGVIRSAHICGPGSICNKETNLLHLVGLLISTY